MQGHEQIKPFFSSHAATKRHHKKVLKIAKEHLETEIAIKQQFPKRTIFESSADFLANSFTRVGGTAVRRRLRREAKRKSKTPCLIHF